MDVLQFIYLFTSQRTLLYFRFFASGTKSQRISICKFLCGYLFLFQSDYNTDLNQIPCDYTVEVRNRFRD